MKKASLGGLSGSTGEKVSAIDKPQMKDKEDD
jgi:hypothetical protein